jgi:hypothetical protein
MFVEVIVHQNRTETGYDSAPEEPVRFFFSYKFYPSGSDRISCLPALFDLLLPGRQPDNPLVVKISIQGTPNGKTHIIFYCPFRSNKRFRRGEKRPVSDLERQQHEHDRSVAV